MDSDRKKAWWVLSARLRLLLNFDNALYCCAYQRRQNYRQRQPLVSLMHHFHHSFCDERELVKEWPFGIVAMSVHDDR